MTEFKVGDRVRYIGPLVSRFTNGKEYEVGGKYYGKKDGRLGIKADNQGDENGYKESDFELIGPVRTVTRREIVPGMYGCVEVLSFDKDGVTITFGPSCPYLCAEELRSAAMVFSQLAEALEDQK